MELPEYNLEGKRALLVGAGRGIGKGIALVLGEAGVDVAVASLTANSSNTVAEQIRATGRRSLALTGDATKLADMNKVISRAIEGLGGIDILVNCVGDSIRMPVASIPNGADGMSEEEWHHILDVNLTSAFTCCSAVGPHFIERRSGVVINISSFASFRAAALRSAYDAGKAGLMRFTESLALEWSQYGIRVNSIAPGMFPDPEQITTEEFKRREEAGVSQVPLGRMGRLREVGLLAVYLASDAASYVTGQTWAIDGGQSIA